MEAYLKFSFLLTWQGQPLSFQRMEGFTLNFPSKELLVHKAIVIKYLSSGKCLHIENTFKSVQLVIPSTVTHLTTTVIHHLRKSLK